MSTELDKKEVAEAGSDSLNSANACCENFSPNVDVYSDDKQVTLIVDLPGVNKGDVSIEVDENDTLIIRGKNSYQEPSNSMIRQYAVGNFYRAFQLLDEYEKEKISAKFQNGVLELVVPRREKDKPKKIEISM